MKYRALGNTGLKVSVVGLGTHQFSGEWAREYSPADVDQIVECAHAAGINYIDTAECYGHHSVEALIGKSIQRQGRENWLLATKFGHRNVPGSPKTDAWSATEVREQLEDSLRALQTDYVDVYQFHSGSNRDFANDELWKMLNEQVRAGKVRFLGISLAGGLTAQNDLQQVHSATEVNARVIQVVYNRLHREAERAILPFCQAEGLGVWARVALAKGFLAGTYRPGTVFPQNDVRSMYGAEFNDAQLKLVEEIQRTELPPGQNMAQWALAWCLRHPAVASVVVGCKSVAQVTLNAGVAEMDLEDRRTLVPAPA